METCDQSRENFGRRRTSCDVRRARPTKILIVAGCGGRDTLRKNRTGDSVFAVSYSRLTIRGVLVVANVIRNFTSRYLKFFAAIFRELITHFQYVHVLVWYVS